VEIGQTHGKFYQNRAVVEEKIKKFRELSFKGL
jgi:hypothetical protein